MDPTGLLDALVAAAVYPGGLFLLVGWGVARALRRGPLRPGPPTSRHALAVLAVAAAVAQLPLPGSPLLDLTAANGEALNLVPVLLLLAVAVDAGGASRAVAAAAAVAGAAGLALAASEHTLSLATLVAPAGPAVSAARALVAAAIVLVAAAGLASRFSPFAAAGLALTAAAAVIPAAMRSFPVVVAALACLAAVALAAGLSWVVRRLDARVVCGCAAGLAVAAGVLVLSTGR